MKYHTHDATVENGAVRQMTPSEKATLRRERWRELVAAAQAGDTTAEETMILLNEGLVRSIAERLMQTSADPRIDFDDLCQNGRIGLITAIRKFQLDRPVAFSTYATWWIRVEMQRARQRARALPMSHRDILAAASVRHVVEECPKAMSIDELASRSGLTPEIVERVTQVPRVVNFPDDDLLECSPVLHDQHATTSFETTLSRTSLQEVLEQILDPDEREILALRHGLDGDNERSLRRIAHETGLPPGRVRRLYASAIDKLRRQEERVVTAVS